MNNESAKTFPTVEIPFAHAITRLPNRLMASSTPIKTTNVSVFMLNSSVSSAHLAGKDQIEQCRDKQGSQHPPRDRGGDRVGDADVDADALPEGGRG